MNDNPIPNKKPQRLRDKIFEFFKRIFSLIKRNAPKSTLLGALIIAQDFVMVGETTIVSRIFNKECNMVLKYLLS